MRVLFYYYASEYCVCFQISQGTLQRLHKGRLRNTVFQQEETVKTASFNFLSRKHCHILNLRCFFENPRAGWSLNGHHGTVAASVASITPGALVKIFKMPEFSPVFLGVLGGYLIRSI